eukprot:6203441-Pleurochrysis_carterae.AAC.2
MLNETSANYYAMNLALQLQLSSLTITLASYIHHEPIILCSDQVTAGRSIRLSRLHGYGRQD